MPEPEVIVLEKIRNCSYGFALRAVDIGYHGLIIIFILGFIKLIETIIHFFWGSQDPVLFRGLGVFEIKVEWLINAMDFCLMVAFGITSIKSFLRNSSDE